MNLKELNTIHGGKDFIRKSKPNIVWTYNSGGFIYCKNVADEAFTVDDAIADDFEVYEQEEVIDKVEMQRKGYDDATQNYEPAFTDLDSYMIGYREGLVIRVKWANEQLATFDHDFEWVRNI